MRTTGCGSPKAPPVYPARAGNLIVDPPGESRLLRPSGLALENGRGPDSGRFAGRPCDVVIELLRCFQPDAARQFIPKRFELPVHEQPEAWLFVRLATWSTYREKGLVGPLGHSQPGRPTSTKSESFDSPSRTSRRVGSLSCLTVSIQSRTVRRNGAGDRNRLDSRRARSMSRRNSRRSPLSNASTSVNPLRLGCCGSWPTCSCLSGGADVLISCHLSAHGPGQLCGVFDDPPSPYSRNEPIPAGDLRERGGQSLQRPSSAGDSIPANDRRAALTARGSGPGALR